MVELQLAPGDKVLISKANRYNRIFNTHKYLLDYRYRDRIIHRYLLLLTIIGLSIAAFQTAFALYLTKKGVILRSMFIRCNTPLFDEI